MRIKSIALIAALLLILPSITNAQTGISSAVSQKTQQMKSIEGNIGYIGLMKPSDRYSFSVNFLPPDGISKVESLDITFMGDFASETIFSVNFNGVACSPDRWTTPKAMASNYRMTFSCSNNVKEAKDINSFRIDVSSDQEAKNVIGWYKINYQSDWNLPEVISKDVKKPMMSIFGTEYIPGDYGTIFLQLKDSNGFPVINGSCYIDIFYPNIGNLSHPQWILNAPMIYKSVSDGIFYYDLTVPNIMGIYMITGSCNYAYLPSFIYTADSINQSKISIVKGTYEGDTMALNSKEDGLYVRCISAAGPSPHQCIATYNFTIYDFITEDNLTKIDIYYMGESTDNGVVLRMSIYNFSNDKYYDLPNSLSYNGKSTTGAALGINDFLSNSVSGTNMSDFIRNRVIIIKLNATNTAPAASFRNWDNWLSLRILTSEGIIIDVKGSGEMHVSNITSSIAIAAASNIWSYPNRTLTDYNQTLTHLFLGQINGSVSGIPTLINQLNSSINAVNISLYDRIGGINASIMNKLYIMQNEMSAFNSSLYSHVSDLGTRLNAINQSISDLIMSVNISISNELYPLVSELNQISSNLSAIITLIGDVNGSLQGRLDNVDAGISSLSTQISNINISIMNKLYRIQDEIGSVNDTVLATNVSIMNKLYLIQGDLDNLLNNITIQLANISNLSLNLTVDLTGIANDVWQLFFQRGTPPLAPSTDYYCSPLDSNVLIKNITYNYQGSNPIAGYFSKEEAVLCSYGCVNRTLFTDHAACDIDPTSKYGLAIVIIVVLCIVFYLFYRFFGKED
jgi:hypothetical protein